MFPLVLCAVLNHVQLFVTPWTAESPSQAPLSMGFFRQECWSGLPFLFQGIFLTQGLNSCLLIAGRFFTTEPPGKPISTNSSSEVTSIFQRVPQKFH